jgi:hypothetical protein
MKNRHQKCLAAPRWKSKFARFVLAYGVARLATELQIRPGAVYQWIRGITAPRRGYAAIVQRLAHESGVKLTLDQIYGHSSELLAVDPGCAMQVPREQFLARARETRLHCEGD